MTFKHEQKFPPFIWVVVADRSRSRILSSSWPKPGDWEEVADLVHGEGSLKASEIHTDRQGLFGEGAGRPHVGEPRTDHKHQTAERFAEEIVRHLEDGRLHQKFGKLGLICPPLFLGVLRKNLPAPLAHMVALEMDKDYTHATIKEITGHLTQELSQ
jgi:protein required for attachment to host cells